MPESIRTITLQALQEASFTMTLPVQISFNQQVVLCHKLLRIVPAKRLVFSGLLLSKKKVDKEGLDKKVIIKLFIHSSRAKKHWQRECAGAKLLSDKQILSPDIITQGFSDEGIYYLIFPFIEGQNLAQFWKKNPPNKKEQKLKELMPVIEKHHRAGLTHQDLHYANFLLSSNHSIYTLDGEEVKVSTAPLAKETRLKNLALFLAQTFDLNQSISCTLLQEYISLTSLTLEKPLCKQFWQWIKIYQQQRIVQYLKKMLRECTEVIFNTSSQGYTLCRRESHTPAIQHLLEQPEQFFQDKNSVYLKQGNTCTVKSVLLDNERYVIKRYNPKGLLYELKHKGQMSRARRSWNNAHLLRFIGILTPEPVALIEQQPELGKRCSYFICKFQAGQTSWDFFSDKEPPNKTLVADKLLSILKRLSEYKITHGDLKGSNFLIHHNQVWLLDLDAMVQHKFNWTFNKKWQRDKRRFLKNWDKKKTYTPWKKHFNHYLP
ncbi:MAG: hypothetical protein KZQ83_12615 [gamma proteobacterium symbiont of Taylorina sp.]|nr:hypothetical protein [gamma proteobacterium symbiont of Taylorina sp.]